MKFVDEDGDTWTRGTVQGSVQMRDDFCWRVVNGTLERFIEGQWAPQADGDRPITGPCVRAAIAALWPTPVRQIAQISPFKNSICVLCDDGTLWRFDPDRYPDGEWIQLKGIAQ